MSIYSLSSLSFSLELGPILSLYFLFCILLCIKIYVILYLCNLITADYFIPCCFLRHVKQFLIKNLFFPHFSLFKVE